MAAVMPTQYLPGNWHQSPTTILEDVAKSANGKKVLLVLDTSGAARLAGVIKKIRHDGLEMEVSAPIAGTEQKRRVFVMVSAIATIEVVE
jgi:hypothetical protein